MKYLTEDQDTIQAGCEACQRVAIISKVYAPISLFGFGLNPPLRCECGVTHHNITVKKTIKCELPQAEAKKTGAPAAANWSDRSLTDDQGKKIRCPVCGLTYLTIDDQCIITCLRCKHQWKAGKTGPN